MLHLNAVARNRTPLSGRFCELYCLLGGGGVGSYVPSQTPGQNPADFHVSSKLPFLAIKTGGSSQPIRVLYELITAFL